MSSPLPGILLPGTIPPTIPINELDLDPTGIEGTYNPSGPTITAQNPFFQSLGSNGRSCGTCHQPATGMSVSAASVIIRYLATNAADSIFAPVDGAVCPDAVQPGGPPSLLAPHNPYALLLTRGLFRVFLPWPPSGVTPEFSIQVLNDPTACENNATYGLNSPNPMVSVYRRPLMAANLKFVTTPGLFVVPAPAPPMDPYTGELEKGNIMFDGREPTLESQVIDATLNHAQAPSAPSAAVVQAIVAFENSIYSAQVYDVQAGNLTANGANGGPVPLLASPAGIPGQPNTFAQYSNWATLSSTAPLSAQRQSVARGEAIFNNRTFTISNVAGFNDFPVIGNNFTGTCATCHNDANAGNDGNFYAQQDTGVSGNSPAALPAPDLPLFLITCTAGQTTAFNGTTMVVRDPGRALITGKCADIGKVKAAQLRALASRAPYFHDGSATTLQDVVNFYNARFAIHFTAQEERDLINFLKTL